jgi:membrane associated rhomboid family serine protease
VVEAKNKTEDVFGNVFIRANPEKEGADKRWDHSWAFCEYPDSDFVGALSFCSFGPPMETETIAAAGADEPVPVAFYPGLPEVQKHALVVLAMQRPCWVLPSGSGYALAVAAADLDAVGRELAEFDREESQGPPRDPVEVHWSGAPGLGISLLLALALFFVFVLQQEHPKLVEFGANSSLATIDGGQWWRPFTSLFLHGDINHVLGNMLSGVCFLTLLIHATGRRLGLALAGLSGVAGNIISAWMHYPEPFRAIGASTAVFGALGTLTGIGVVDAVAGRGRAAALIIPLIGGVTMLAWTGTGGLRTDLASHFAGFGVGFLLGLVTGMLRLRRSE